MKRRTNNIINYIYYYTSLNLQNSVSSIQYKRVHLYAIYTKLDFSFLYLSPGKLILSPVSVVLTPYSSIVKVECNRRR